jgi:hypothetical protein
MKRREFLLGGAAFFLACRERGETDPEANLAFATLPAEDLAAPAPIVTPILGINSHLLLDDDLRLIRELGITHVRNTVFTQLWTDHPGYAAAMQENAARTADYGLQLLLVVHNAYGRVFRMGHDQAAGRRYIGIMSDIVRRMPTVEAWQLWNEQDVWVQAPFGAGSIPPQNERRVGENYARWWREAYTTLKQVNPAALLVTGGPADHPANRWRSFLRGMVESGVEADAIALHAYGAWDRVRPRLLEARQLVGDRPPLWLTECGALPDAQWTPEYHAEAWRSVIQGNERERLAERVYLYALQTDPNDPWHGVFNLDGTPRPVLHWLRARVASR